MGLVCAAADLVLMGSVNVLMVTESSASHPLVTLQKSSMSFLIAAKAALKTSVSSVMFLFVCQNKEKLFHCFTSYRRVQILTEGY